MTRSQNGRSSFSLLEVVVALGIVATVLMALLAWFGPAMRTAAGTSDAQIAAGLADDLQLELERLQSTLGLDGLAAVVPAAESGAALRLVATRDGRRVCCADAANPTAEHSLDDPVLPGIAWRDRFFLAEVVRQPDLPCRPGAGFLAVNVRVSWPYRMPLGPASAGVNRPSADPSREVPNEERECLVFAFALRP